jgi:hypothetical protein
MTEIKCCDELWLKVSKVDDRIKAKYLTPIDVKLRPHNLMESLGYVSEKSTINEIIRDEQCI